MIPLSSVMNIWSKKMHIRRKLTVIVVGLGNFGAHVAQEMAKMGHTVIAIDSDEDRVQAIGDVVDKAVIGDACKQDVLKSIGAEQADLAVVSMGDRIDYSALSTLHLKELGVSEIWVKVVSNDHAELMRRIGAGNTIFPERDMAMRLAQRLSSPNIVERLSFTADFGILEFTVPESMSGKGLIDLDLRRKFSINAIGLKEVNKGKSFLSPDPSQPLHEGDLLFLLGHLENLEKFQKEIGK
jgi:trk system potassium uptake protein TrkA